MNAHDNTTRRFHLVRDVDHTGLSGTGYVAAGVRFGDLGPVVIRWFGAYASTVIWDNIDHAMAIHGHGGATRVEWVD